MRGKRRIFLRLQLVILLIALSILPYIVFAEELTPSENPVSQQTSTEQTLADNQALLPNVPENHWAYEDISQLYQQGMIRLDNGNQLTPDQPITRAQFIYMILTGKGISPVPTIGNHFKDVNPDDWFYPYVEMAFQIGLTNGTKKGETNYFYPNDLLTREEMVTLLVRAQGKMREAQVIPWGEATEALKSFPDQWDLEDWARRPFAYALQKGITKAYPDGLLRPKKISTVAEAASFVYRGLYLPRTNLKTAQVDGITIYYTSKIEGMKTTAYSKGEPTVPGVFTRMGLFVRKGLVAVDPNVIPLGTYLYVEGYGFAMAADTGGAIKGNVIDLYVESIEKARKHGVDYRNVYILN